MTRTCPDCAALLTVQAFNEATIYKCSCGYSEAWHRFVAEDNPQITHGQVGLGGCVCPGPDTCAGPPCRSAA